MPSSPPSSPTPTLKPTTPTAKPILLATLTPPNPTRAWQTSPHPTLPLIATCYTDRTVRIYSLQNFTLHSTITGGHKRSIRSVAWKPQTPKNELVVATGGFDASVGLWRYFLDPEGEGDDATEQDFTSRGPTGKGGGEEGEEEEDEWHFSIILDGHDSEIKSVAFSTAGNFLATCSRDKSVWIWEEVAEDEWETVAVLSEHEGDVKAVQWHPEEEVVGSASYDDEVRLWRDEGDDWGCVWRSGIAKVEGDGGKGTGEEAGHKATVWGFSWEGVKSVVYGKDREGSVEWRERREKAGPRFATCSDDLSVKIWRRVPKERQQQSRLSIIKSRDSGEEWVLEGELPKAHSRSIYAVAWSAKTGRIVTCGGDGLVVVYQEDWFDEEKAPAVNGEKPHGEQGEEGGEESKDNGKADKLETKPLGRMTGWKVVAQIDAAHGVFEINHVTWCNKPKSRQQASAGEEWILTTGDDGSVKVWDLEI